MGPPGVPCHYQHYQGETWTNVYLPQRGNWQQTTVSIPLKSKLRLSYKIMGRGDLQEDDWHKGSSVTKSLPQPGWLPMRTGTLKHTATSWSISWGAWLVCPSTKHLHLPFVSSAVLTANIALEGRNSVFLISFSDFLRLLDEPPFRTLELSFHKLPPRIKMF